MLRYLIPELEAHADVGNAAEERFKHRFGLITIAVGREVRQDASKFIAGDKCPIGSHHHVVANGKVSQWQQLAYGGSLEFLLVLRVGHRHGSNPSAPTYVRRLVTLLLRSERVKRRLHGIGMRTERLQTLPAPLRGRDVHRLIHLVSPRSKPAYAYSSSSTT